MHLFLLGGLSPRNEKWIEEVSSNVKGSFDTTSVQRYRHWQTGETSMDVDYEVSILAEASRNLENFMIFAKSAGCWVVLRAVKEGLIFPAKCVFTGTAVNLARANDIPIDTWLEGYSVPSLFIQKTSDPAIGYAELEALLAERQVRNHQMIKVPGEDHSYDNVSQLGQWITEFAGK